MKNSLLAWTQKILSPFCYTFGGGCNIDRKLWQYFSNTKFSYINLNYCNPFNRNVIFLINALVYGEATK